MKRLSVATALAAGLFVSIAAPATAEWPADRPIRILVGFGAGGGTDIVSRIIAQPLSELLKQTVVVENKVGAGGTLAAEAVAHADKDGYTALMTSPAHTVSAAMLKSIRYDAVKDFAPVSWVADSAFVFVARKNFPADDIKGSDRPGQGLTRQAQLCRCRCRLDPELRRRVDAPNGRHRCEAHPL